MADVKNVVIYAAISVTVVLVISGITVRSWLKGRIEAAGSPTAFASQLALSSLERKIGGELGKSLTPSQREKLQVTIRKTQGMSRNFNQAQTIRLFQVLDNFDKHTKNENGHPSEESILSLVSDLESLCSSNAPHLPGNS
jgi:hypothetical protein